MVCELTSFLQSYAIGVPKHFDNEHDTVPVLRPFHLLQFYNCDLQDLKFSHNAKSTLPQGSSPFFQLVCQHSQSGITTSVAAFASNTVESFHGPRQDVSRSRAYAHDEVLCASCPRHEFAFLVLQRWRLSQTFRVHQGWIGSCWSCC